MQSKLKCMLLEPTGKYINYVCNSKHYQNCPKFMLNYQIRCIIRLTESSKVVNVVREIFQYYKLPLKLVDGCIKYHTTTSENDFYEINVNPYLDNTPPHVAQITERIDRWIAANTEPVTFMNPFPNIPSYPFKK